MSSRCRSVLSHAITERLFGFQNVQASVFLTALSSTDDGAVSFLVGKLEEVQEGSNLVATIQDLSLGSYMMREVHALRTLGLTHPSLQTFLRGVPLAT